MMASLGERYGNWALVAGAAEGIGEGFCNVLAAEGFNLIMVDRNEPAMKALAGKIEQEHRVKTLELHLDLAEKDAAGKCMQAVISCNCRLMVYVAARSRVCRFDRLDSAELDGFLDVNARTLLHLVHGFANRLISGGEKGGILLVSSLAGLIGPEYVAVYAATKAFSIRLAEALHDELKDRGIVITVCCSGTVPTPTYRSSRPDLSKLKPPMMQPGDVARYALNRLGVRTICIPGFRNRLQYFFLMNLVPRKTASRLVNNAMKKMYGKL